MRLLGSPWQRVTGVTERAMAIGQLPLSCQGSHRQHSAFQTISGELAWPARPLLLTVASSARTSCRSPES